MIKIIPEMTVDKIFEIAPDAVIILKNAKLDCTGCNARTDRTLERVFEMNATAKEQQEKILEHLNKLKQRDEKLAEPSPEDLKVQEIEEGNKKYYKLAGLLFTANAYRNLHQLAEKKGLRIRLATGGCSGFKYEFDFYDDAEKDQREYKLSDQLSIYLDDFSFDRSRGSIVDFTFGLHSSGLQIINPNSKRSCSCGVSIGF